MVNKKFLGLILCAEKQLDIANEIQHFFNDNDSIEVENYRHSYMFTPGTSDIGNLIASKNKYDFVIIVLTPDELSQKNNSNQYTPRDNVILEIGFFIGTLGIEKTILLKDESLNLVLPSYLDGITIAKFSRTGQLSLRAKLVSPCLEIERSIKTKTYRSVVSPTYWTNKLVIASLKVVCNALETPSSFDIAKLRAFIFKKKDNYLVCTHHWANQVIKEEVDHLKFEINEDTSNEVAVVKAAIRKEVVATYVKPLRKKTKKKGAGLESVDYNLKFVLAAPILSPNGEIWGTIDIDTLSDHGADLLKHEGVKPVIFNLGRQLYLALSSTKSIYLN